MKHNQTIEKIRMCFELVSRAVRRGDKLQMNSALNELAEIWRTQSDWPDPATKEYAIGMKEALEGVLGFALARWRGDKSHELLNESNNARILLLTLAKNKRILCLEEKKKNPENYSSENIPGIGKDLLIYLAKCTGFVQVDNLQEIIEKLKELGLITEKLDEISITNDGVNLLEAKFPGWQITNINHMLKVHS